MLTVFGLARLLMSLLFTWMTIVVKMRLFL